MSRATGKGKGSGDKKVKDPNAPKRPMPAYFHWLKENRESIKKPGMSVTDISKAAGVLWGKMDTEEKNKWQQVANKDKDRYNKEVSEYNKDG